LDIDVSHAGVVNITILRGMVQRLGALSGIKLSSEDQIQIWSLVTQHFLIRASRTPRPNGTMLRVDAVGWLQFLELVLDGCITHRALAATIAIESIEVSEHESFVPSICH
jgi:hypothetical protein